LWLELVVISKQGEPVHKWKLASIHDIADWEPASLLVEEFMTTDISTVSKDDIPELCADMMDWGKIRYIPIEDKNGELIGMITTRELLRHFNDLQINGKGYRKNVTLKDLMITDPITISPEATVVEAMEVMRKYNVGCLPVVMNKKLVGIITERNFLNITASLLKRFAARKKKYRKTLADLENGSKEKK